MFVRTLHHILLNSLKIFYPILNDYLNIQSGRVNRHLLAALALIFATLAGVWWWASYYNYIPCISDCGETFISQLYARNYRLFGFDYGLVEDHATSPLAAAHPYYYTHNVNLGGLFYTLLEIGGVQSFVAKQFFVLLIFGVGLFYIYLATAYHSRSRLLALTVLLIACTDFGLFLSFGIHALRVWSWLAIFGLLLHVGRLAYEIRTPRWVDYFGIFIFGAIAFGIGYEFWIVCLGIVAATFFFCFPRSHSVKKAVRPLFIILCIIFIPFVLRQIHIAMVLGFDYWKTDFLYSFAIKIPFAGLIFKIPPINEINQWYESFNIMRPPSDATDSLPQLRGVIAQTYEAFLIAVVPIVGSLGVFLTTVVSMLGTVWAIINRCLKHQPSGADNHEVHSAAAVNETSGELRKAANAADATIDLRRVANLIAGLCVGMGAGNLVMLKMVVPFYITMTMPMLGAVFVLCKGAVLATLVQFAVNRRGALRVVQWPAIFAALIIIDQVLIQIGNVKAARPMETGWIQTVQDNSKATYAVSFIAPVVAGFTENWAVGIKTSDDREFLRRANDGHPPFEKKDLFWFGERDADARNWTYLQPDYWLYFPIDRRVQYYAIEPECRKDYLARALSPFIDGVHLPEKVVANSWVNPEKLRPSEKTVVGIVVKRGVEISDVKIQISEKNITKASYNCVNRVAVAEIELPGKPGVYDVSALIRLAYGLGELKIPIGKVKVDPAAPSNRPQYLAKPQPTVESIIAEYPNLKIIDKRVTPNPWEGYLLIDLRDIYKK